MMEMFAAAIMMVGSIWAICWHNVQRLKIEERLIQAKIKADLSRQDGASDDL